MLIRETLKVNERRDDTTKAETESRPAPTAGRYYDDDATGYETYRPEEDEGEPEDDARAEESGLRPGLTPGTPQAQAPPV